MYVPVSCARVLLETRFHHQSVGCSQAGAYTACFFGGSVRCLAHAYPVETRTVRPSPPLIPAYLTLVLVHTLAAIGAEGELQGSVTSITQMLLPPPGKTSGGTSESGGAAAGVVHGGTGDGSSTSGTLTPGQEENVREGGGEGERGTC